MPVVKDGIKPNNLSDLCRSCLKLTTDMNRLDLTSIYDETENVTFAGCLKICTNVELCKDDALPQNICLPCGAELQVTYDFLKKMENSTKILEHYIREIHESTKESDAEPDTVQSSERDITSLSDTSVEQQRVETLLKSSVTKMLLMGAEEDDFVPDLPDITKSVKIINVTSEYTESMDSVEYDNNQQANADVLSDCESFVLEEHLDFSMDTLNTDVDADETLHIIAESLIRIDRDENNMFKELKGTADDVAETKRDEQSTVTQPIPNTNQVLYQEVGLKTVTRKWQENVVAVASENHLPLEADNTASIHKSVKREAGQSDVKLEAGESNDKLETGQIEVDVEIVDTNEDSKPTSLQPAPPRKRHIGSYTCDICKKIFPNFSRMANHRRCHEVDRPKYPCGSCGRVYATKQAMECHVKTEHEKIGFSCTVCSKVFAIRRSLEVHMRYHNGEFPYKCDLCVKKFAQLCHLNTHKNVKHNNVRFACDHKNCGKYFTSSTSLRNHEYSHSVMPFECNFCQRGYPAKAKLKIHIKRKHDVDATKEELEGMRKFHVTRSKINLVQLVHVEEEEANDDPDDINNAEYLKSN